MEGLAAQAAAQAAESLVVEGSQGIFSCLKSKYFSVQNISKNFEDLERNERRLRGVENDVKITLDRNRVNMEKTSRCHTWLIEVEELKKEIGILKINYEKTRRFFCGLCPFLVLLKLSKRIAEKSAEAVSLIDQIAKITIMTERGPARVIKKHGRKIEDVPSLKQHVRTLHECLSNEALKRICLWGASGVGKTTIMANVHDLVGESPDEFDIVLWVDLNEKGNGNDLQKALLSRLNLRAGDHHSDEEKAAMISETLRDRRYVLFIDNVFTEIDLRKSGIYDEHEHGKVVLCSCRNIRGLTGKAIHVKKLDMVEVEDIFWKIVGVNLKSDTEILQTAGSIIRLCGGILRLIETIGSSLKDVTDPAIWRHNSRPTQQRHEFEKFFKAFKLVYEKLDRDMQPCLLYWAVFPVGYELHRDYIIECWRAEQFFTDFTKLGEARDKGHVILHEFVNRSLLEKGREEGHYRMFEHFQRVALDIANSNEWRILVKDREKIKEEEWKLANRISIFHSSVSTLPENPNCLKILTLLLQDKNLAEIPRSFFRDMDCLQLLDLHNTKIRSIPSSISILKNLRALFLNHCDRLTQLPEEVGDLCGLEILDVSHTGIFSLPTKIGHLTNLKCLRASFRKYNARQNHVETGGSNIISRNIIARLHSLEELSIFVDPNDTRWDRNVRNIVDEVAALEELTTLYFYFPKLEFFQTLILRSKSWNQDNKWRSDRVRSFNFFVGYQQSNPPAEFVASGWLAENHLRISECKGFHLAISKILEKAYTFELIGHQDSPDLSGFGSNNLQRLEACRVEDCRKMTSIIDGGQAKGIAFQHLNKLHIINLPNLVHIWKGEVKPQSLIMLTTLTVKGCHKLKTLFSKVMVPRLKRLHYLQVEDCQLIEEIVEDGSVDESAAFPKLRNLELIKLPRLSNICNHVSLTWNSLETIKVEECEQLRNLSSTFQNANKMIVIHCPQAQWNQLVWPNNGVRDRFQRLRLPIR